MPGGLRHANTDHVVRALAKVKVAEMYNRSLDLHHVLVLRSTELANARDELEQFRESVLVVVRMLAETTRGERVSWAHQLYTHKHTTAIRSAGT